MPSSKETEPITSTTTPNEVDHDDAMMETSFTSRAGCCSMIFPCFGSSSSSSPSVWERLQQTAERDNTWWARPLRGLKKAREWSEIIAGPKWKTFLRRFNSNHSNRVCSSSRSSKNGKFQYDPLSYSLNFDEGQGHNGHLEDDAVSGYFPDFSSRFASLPSSCKSSMDLGKTVIPLSD
ncbi:hypothetical protein vseg_003122 [Gypsophila vaccaria]